MWRRLAFDVSCLLWSVLLLCFVFVVFCPGAGWCFERQEGLEKGRCLPQSVEVQQAQQDAVLMGRRVTQDLHAWLKAPVCQSASPHAAYCQLLKQEAERLAQDPFSIDNYYDWTQLQSYLAILAQASDRASQQDGSTLLTDGQTIWLTLYQGLREVQTASGVDDDRFDRLLIASGAQMEKLEVTAAQATFLARCKRTLDGLFQEQDIVFVAEHHEEQEAAWMRECVIAYGQQVPILYLEENKDMSATLVTGQANTLSAGEAGNSIAIGLEDDLLSPLTSLLASAASGEQAVAFYQNMGHRIAPARFEQAKQEILALWLLTCHTSQLRETLLLALQQESPKLAELLRELLANYPYSCAREHRLIQEDFEQALQEVWLQGDERVVIDLGVLHKLTKRLLTAHVPFLDEPIALTAVQACLDHNRCKQHSIDVMLYARTTDWLTQIHRLRDRYPNHYVVLQAGALHIPMLQQALRHGFCAQEVKPLDE